MIQISKLTAVIVVVIFYSLQVSANCGCSDCNDQGLFPILQNVAEGSTINYWYRCNETDYVWCISSNGSQFGEKLSSTSPLYGVFFDRGVEGSNCMGNELNRTLSATLEVDRIFHGATVFLSIGLCNDLIVNSAEIESQGMRGRLFVINIQEPIVSNTCSPVSVLPSTAVLSPSTHFEALTSTEVCPSIIITATTTIEVPTVSTVRHTVATTVIVTSTKTVTPTPGVAESFESPPERGVIVVLSIVAVVGIAATIILSVIVLLYCRKATAHPQADQVTVNPHSQEDAQFDRGLENSSRPLAVANELNGAMPG